MDEDKKRESIKNLWFLLLYASEYFKYIEEKNGRSIDGNTDNLADLIAKILVETVKLRLKDSLNLSYQPRQETLRRVRGRIDLLKTERRQLLQKGQIACRFEELTIDTPRNHFVRDALEKIARSVEDKDLANKCRMQALSLRRAGVKGIAPSRKEMENQRYGRNDKNDKAMIFASILAFQLSLPYESNSFNDLLSPDSTRKLSDLYERAVANFYKKVLSSKNWQVLRQNEITWEITEYKEDTKKYVPNMYADIILNNKDENKTIVIDTKFKEIIKEDNRYGDDGSKKLRSSDIYQIYTYLISQKGKDDSRIRYKAEALLLYPAFDKNKTDKMDETFGLGDFNVRFVEVDFTQNERAIRNRLIEIIEPQ